MDKEDFLTIAMTMLSTYINNDRALALTMLEEANISEDDIPSILYTIINWRS